MEWSWNSWRADRKLADVLSAKPPQCTCSRTPAWDRDLGPFNTPLTRYRLPKHATCHGCGVGTGVFEDAFHVLLRSLPPSRAIAARGYFYRIKTAIPNACECHARSVFKELDAMAKQAGPYFSRNWLDYVSWAMLFGYVPPDPALMAEDVFQWLGVPRVNGLPGREEEFLERLRYHVCEVYVQHAKQPEYPPQQAADWVKGGSWMMGKGGTGSPTSITIDGKTVRTRRTKGTEGYHMADADILRSLTTPYPETCEVMLKSEAGKSRPVAKTGNQMYWKMAFCSQWVEGLLRSSAFSTLFMNARQREEMDFAIMRRCATSDSYFVPLDQKNFDWHQSKKAVFAALLGMADAMRKLDVQCPDFWHVWDAIMTSLSLPMTVRFEQHTFPWRGGLPSGFRWTALIGTLLNIASFRAVKEIARTLSFEGDTDLEFFQGDDVTYCTNSLQLGWAIMNLYRDCGYDINPQKTFVSRTRTEFLRKVYSPLTVVGYPARSVVAIMYRNPIKRPAPCREARVSSRLRVWHILSLRTGAIDVAAMAFLEDANQLGVPPFTATSFALTPASWGGLGVMEDSQWGQAILRLTRPTRLQWTVPRLNVDARHVRVRLGKWSSRLAELPHRLSESAMSDFMLTLAQSWGIDPSKLVGDISVTWVTIPVLEPAPFQFSDPAVPPYEDIWDMQTIPRHLRSHVQRDSLTNGTWPLYVKSQHVDLLIAWNRRVSASVFKGHLLGEWEPSVPVIDNVGPQYTRKFVGWARYALLGLLGRKSLGVIRLRQHLHWLELLIARHIKENWSTLLLAA